jgi:hypothetical protein
MVQQDSFCGHRAQPLQIVEKRAVRTDEFCDMLNAQYTLLGQRQQ